MAFISMFPIIGCTKIEKPNPEAIHESSKNLSQEPSNKEEKPFQYCADHTLCKKFRETEQACRTLSKEEICTEFVEIFKKLAVKMDCKRPFDTQPVPSVWICDEDAEETSYPKLFERAATTLANTKFKFAQDFYGSEAFRSTLDGAVAEEHLKKSMDVGKNKDH
ncbi:MAG: hypothetical protein KDD33_03395 [Bdellovibrionales bacterium]|nr:hypothetical protein [Bdellovibrionales bacterium]